MRNISEADKVWLRQQIRTAVRQVLYEEFGEVLKFLRFVKEEGDLDALAKMVNSGDEEAEDGEDGGEDVGRGKAYLDVLLP